MKGKHYTQRKRGLSYRCLVIIALLSICSIVLGKYSKKIDENALMEADKFVFTSNYSDGGVYNIYNNYIVITLSNYELDYINQSDIEYTVSIKDKDGNPVSYSDSGNGKISGAKENTTEIKATNLENGKTYMVEIDAIKPYSRSLNMQFDVVETLPTENYYSVTKNDGWIKLDIYIGANVPSNGITVNYTGLSPDNTNEMMRDWFLNDGDDSGVLTNLDTYSQYTLIFFGDGNDVSKTKIENDVINL